MTIMRVSFAGTIMKAEHKQAGTKPICEVSLCKKHKGRNGAEDSFTWLRVSLWEPAEFQVAKLVKGNFIAGSGDLQLRSFEHKGEKRQSLECRCTSFDVEVSDGGKAISDGDTAILPPTAAAAVAREKAQDNNEEIPF
jgi:single-stranded DNA-binding protein